MIAFMKSKPKHLKYEGYWDQNKKGYWPVRFPCCWSDKQDWLKKVYSIERYLQESNQYIVYRGFSPSRLVKGELVGCGEYIDRKYGMGWPQGYVKHYIEEQEVPPTERFYNYILTRYETIPEEYKIINEL